MTIRQEEQFYSMMFGTCCNEEETLTLSDLDESIAEIQAILSYVIEQSDQKEIKAWRRMLQEAKVTRRELLTT